MNCYGLFFFFFGRKGQGTPEEGVIEIYTHKINGFHLMFARFTSSFLHILFVFDLGISRGLDCPGGVIGVSVW